MTRGFSSIYVCSQESGRRAGTENVLLAVALGAAARLAVDQVRALSVQMGTKRCALELLIL